MIDRRKRLRRGAEAPRRATSPAHERAMARTCAGACGEHRGAVRRVRVYDNTPGGPWRFTYCEAAIAEDLRRGLAVEPDDETSENATILPAHARAASNDERKHGQ